MEKPTTVDELLDLFQKLHDAGYGSFNIQLSDDIVREGDIGVDYTNKVVTMRGHLYNCDITKSTAQLEDDIRKAIEKFYNSRR